MTDLAITYLGSPLDEFARKLPSYLRGSVLQSIACYEAPGVFARRGGPAVLLVPGLFCTPSVMNRLGRELEALGADVYLPSPAPLGPGVLANTCRLEEAAELFLQDLAALKARGVERLTVAGHSNGGLIALLAMEQARDRALDLPVLEGVVCMGSPLKGSPIARGLRSLVPACKDVAPGAFTLERLARQGGLVRRILVSGFDILVPEYNQVVGQADRVVLEGFQHMDFIVGSREQIMRAAGLIWEVLPHAA